MIKTLALPIFDVGFELEFFLLKQPPKNTYPKVVLNANKEMAERLGFTIDQNVANAGSLNLGNGYDLVTDGTAAELRWFKPDNRGILPQDHAAIIAQTKPLDGLVHSFWPCLRAGEKQFGFGQPMTFDSPGRVFASQKMITNAYTGETKWADKKDDGEVTLRTAGLHLHFSVSDGATNNMMGKKVDTDLSALIFWPHPDQHVNSLDNKKHTNALVKILDGIVEAQLWQKHGVYMPDASKTRVEEYQTKGDYRIRAEAHTVTRKPTLEYRQLDSYLGGASGFPRVQQIIDIFQYEAKKYLEGVINA